MNDLINTVFFRIFVALPVVAQIALFQLAMKLRLYILAYDLADHTNVYFSDALFYVWEHKTGCKTINECYIKLGRA